MCLIALWSLLILKTLPELSLFNQISHLRSLHDHPFYLGVSVITTVSVIEGVFLREWVIEWVCEFESPVSLKVHAATPTKTSYKSVYNSITTYNSYPGLLDILSTLEALLYDFWTILDKMDKNFDKMYLGKIRGVYYFLGLKWEAELSISNQMSQYQNCIGYIKILIGYIWSKEGMWWV